MSRSFGGGPKSQVDLECLLDATTLELVRELVGLGALVSIGSSRDGGALSVHVRSGEIREREWFRTDVELHDWLSEGVAAVHAALGGGPSSFSQGFSCPDLLENINNKVSDTWHTWLSQSLANLSRLFCSPRKFLTLRRMVVAPAVPCGGFVEFPEILCMVDLYLTTPYAFSPTSLST